jgi:hypothetical protein
MIRKKYFLNFPMKNYLKIIQLCKGCCFFFFFFLRSPKERRQHHPIQRPNWDDTLIYQARKEKLQTIFLARYSASSSRLLLGLFHHRRLPSSFAAATFCLLYLSSSSSSSSISSSSRPSRFTTRESWWGIFLSF